LNISGEFGAQKKGANKARVEVTIRCMKNVKKIVTAIILFTVTLLLAAAVSSCLNPQKSLQKSSADPTKKQRDTGKNKNSSALAFDYEPATDDPFNDPNGPFFHKVYKATSNDGLNFIRENQVLLDKASVPDAVRTKDGRIFVYAVDGAKRSKTGIMVAISDDNGKTFRQGSIRIIGKDEIEPLADPQAILTDDKIRLFYVVFPKTKPPLDASGRPIPTGDKIKIKSALSKDGVNFQEEPGSRYETTEIVTDPDVIKIGANWFMYLSLGTRLIATSSSDGKSFKTEKTIRENGSVSKTVPIENQKYRQFFCKGGISSAVTTDGLNWVDEGGVRLKVEQGEIVCDPSPVRIGEEWIMFFKSAVPASPKGPPQ